MTLSYIPKKTIPTFWITNITNRLVSLTDLAISIKPYTSVNLLDRKHYHFTLQQLNDSKDSGSLFKKSKLIKIRLIPPHQEKQNFPVFGEEGLPIRQKSGVEIKEEKYEELDAMFMDEEPENKPIK